MDRPEKKTCRYCQFYAGGKHMGAQKPDDDVDGGCRQYAPRGVWPTRFVDGTHDYGDMVTGFYMPPMVYHDFWCGEFSERA